MFRTARAYSAMTVMGLLLGATTLSFGQQDPPSAPSAKSPVPEAPTAEPAVPHASDSPAADNTSPSKELADNPEGFDTLARGPIHESFAEPIALNVTESVAVDRQPPEPIQEIPPAARPDGNTEWIPGYWSWDDERSDFLWVSGTWRAVPYGHRWVPGYWRQTGDGYVRITGFWNSAESADVTYLPDPPETIEEGPVGNPPSDQHFWVPGAWMYRDNDYAWRAGYWAQSYPDWMWIPDRYVWTPRGSIFVAGFWDYPYARRGMLFAPIYFPRPIYQQAGFFFSPSVGINIAGLHFHLFARPNYHHYYFGDYYDDVYASAGFFPWFAFNEWRGYDPFFHFHHHHSRRGDRDWDSDYRERYRWYRDHKEARPAHTFADLRRQLPRFDKDRRNESEVLVSLRDADKIDRLTTRRITSVAENQRRRFAEDAQRRERLVQNRRLDFEKQTRVTLKPGDDNDPRNADQKPPVLQLPEKPRMSNPTDGVNHRDDNVRPQGRERMEKDRQPRRQIDPPTNLPRGNQKPGNDDRGLSPRRERPDNLPKTEPRQPQRPVLPDQPSRPQIPERGDRSRRMDEVVPPRPVTPPQGGRDAVRPQNPNRSARPDVQVPRNSGRPEPRKPQTRVQPERPRRAEPQAPSQTAKPKGPVPRTDSTNKKQSSDDDKKKESKK